MAREHSEKMMSVVLVVAPHPDDETLGCGGTLLRHASQGDEVHWLIATRSVQSDAVDRAEVDRGECVIQKVAKDYGFSGVHRTPFETTGLDAIALATLVPAAADIIARVQPQVVYLPHPGDVHSDHRRAFEMCASSLKWFRTATVRQIYAYETLSETGFGLGSTDPFRADRYVDIRAQVDRKVEILENYASELGTFPFPRSGTAIRALAAVRGAESGFDAAEAFQVLRIRE